MAKKLSESQRRILGWMNNGVDIMARDHGNPGIWRTAIHGITIPKQTIEFLERYGYISISKEQGKYNRYYVATLTDAGRKALEDNRD